MGKYANLTNATAPNKSGGYKNSAWFSPISDIGTWQRPTAAGLVSGDTKLISTAHTWVANKGAYSWEARIGSVQHTSESGGDTGAKELIHVVRMDVLGDGPSILEQMETLLNENSVFFIKDANCLVADAYYQIGDDCNPCSATINFDSQVNNPDQANGQKRYTVELRSKAKYFYSAAVDVTFA